MAEYESIPAWMSVGSFLLMVGAMIQLFRIGERAWLDGQVPSGELD